MKNILIIMVLLYGMACSAEETKSYSELWDIEVKKSPTGVLCNAEMGDLMHNEYKRVDKILNVTFKKALKSLEGETEEIDKTEKENLRKAQRYWIKYRDAECYSQSYHMRAGTGEYILIAPCLIDMTEMRTKLLEEHFWLNEIQ